MILITGVSRGLGQYLYKNLNKNHIAHGTVRTKSKKNFHNGIYNNIDLTNPNNFDFLEKNLSKYTCLINNIGIAYDGLLATQSIKSIEDVLNVNLTQSIILTKHYIRSRIPKGGGNVINISSICSLKGFKGLASYGASKAGLNSLSMTLAREMGPANFRINSISPGYFKTDMSSKIGNENLEKIIKRTPLKRLTEKRDVYNLVEFLISPKSKMITGQNIVVDGGFTI